MNVLALCGSLRRGSYNRALLAAAEELAPDGVRIAVFERLRDVPLYDPGEDEAYTPGKLAPEPVQALRAALRATDALLISTPEYNYSVPGLLKNAVDWASRPAGRSPLVGLPTALMGASTGMGGTMRAQYHLRQSFVHTNTPSVLQPEVLCAFCAPKFDADGRLTDEKTRELVGGLLAALADLARRWPRR